MKHLGRWMFAVFWSSAVSSASAGGLWFSADYQGGAFDTHCRYEMVTPVINPRGWSAEQEGVRVLTKRFNAARKLERDAKIQAMQAAFAEGKCNGSDNTHFASSFFTVTTPLYSNYVAFLITDYQYWGGTGQYNFLTKHRSYVYNLAARWDNEIHIASLAALFDAKQFQAVVQRIEEKLVAADYFPLEMGWNSIKSRWTGLSDITNFYPSDKGIVIFFGDGELGFPVEDIYEVTISWDEALNDIGMLWEGEQMAKALMLRMR